MKIYITGASCAGVTTLGSMLAKKCAIRHVDVDDFYWLPTDPPYTQKRPPEQRVQLIKARLDTTSWVLTGSFDGWGDALIEDADLIVFVLTPHDVRMSRLMAREPERYGDRILPGGDMHDNHRAFANWASQYEAPGPGHAGRSLPRHESWLALQTLPVLRVDGARRVDELVQTVIQTGERLVNPGASAR